MKIQNSAPVITPTGKSVNASTDSGKRSESSASQTQELQTSNARRAIQDSGEVDLAKVSALRDAIANGDLSLDPEVLAEAVVGMHRQ